VFFATPHHGGNGASIADIVAKFARNSISDISNNVLKTLQKNDFYANLLSDNFKNMCATYNYKILSFYETMPFKGKFGLVIE
jgi:hypothetical protein